MNKHPSPRTWPPCHAPLTGNIVQQYDHHLGPINSILFVDNDRRIVTTSDDKKVVCVCVCVCVGWLVGWLFGWLANVVDVVVRPKGSLV